MPSTSALISFTNCYPYTCLMFSQFPYRLLGEYAWKGVHWALHRVFTKKFTPQTVWPIPLKASHVRVKKNEPSASTW